MTVLVVPAAGCQAPDDSVERFAAKAVDTTGDPGDHEFTVVVNSSGQEFTVPRDKSIVQVLLDNNVKIMTSCAEGVCGTCETKVISGEIAHRDQLLSDEDREEGVLAEHGPGGVGDEDAVGAGVQGDGRARRLGTREGGRDGHPRKIAQGCHRAGGANRCEW